MAGQSTERKARKKISILMTLAYSWTNFMKMFLFPRQWVSRDSQGKSTFVSHWDSSCDYPCMFYEISFKYSYSLNKYRWVNFEYLYLIWALETQIELDITHILKEFTIYGELVSLFNLFLIILIVGSCFIIQCINLWLWIV